MSDLSVSVVIPAFNAEATLERTLTSVTAQTYPSHEVIVVNDGSTDGTAGIARQHGARGLSKANAGLSRARNDGAAAARGATLAFLDADDMWRPTKLARQVEVLRQRLGVGAVMTAASRVNERDDVIGTLPARSGPDLCRTLLLGSMAAGPISSILIRRDVFRRVGGFDPRFSQCADWHFMLELAQLTEVAIINEPLTLYRSTGTSMSRDIKLLERDTFAVLDDFFARAPSAAMYDALRARAYGRHWMICSGSYLHAGHPRDAMRCLLEGVRTDPAAARRPLGLPVRCLRRRIRMIERTR